MRIFDMFQLFKSFQFCQRTKQQQNSFRIPNNKIPKPSGFFLSRILRIYFIRILEEFLEEMSSVIVENNYKRPCFFINRQYPMPSLPLPLVGHSHLLFNINREDILDTILTLVKVDTNQRKVMVFIGNQQLIWYFHPEPAEEILSSNEIISKSNEYIYLQVCKKRSQFRNLGKV